MNKDYRYCRNQNTCIHRRGCKRWIGNYAYDEAVEEANNNIRGYVADDSCIDSHKRDTSIMPYYMLDRFRLSNGEPMQ